jgi:hypothetical protein
MVAEDQTLKYSGYTTTAYVAELAGVEDDDDWSNADVNKKIKAAETFINGETGLSWYPYDDNLITNLAPANIAEATAFFASAFINAELKDKDKTYKNHIEIGTLLLGSYVKNTTLFNAKLREWILSDYLTEPSNPDAPKYITGPI